MYVGDYWSNKRWLLLIYYLVFIGGLVILECGFYWGVGDVW